jgi:hypothetical protein
LRGLPLSFQASSFFAATAAQATPIDPARFVVSIYADGREDVVWVQWLDGGRRG